MMCLECSEYDCRGSCSTRVRKTKSTPSHNTKKTCKLGYPKDMSRVQFHFIRRPEGLGWVRNVAADIDNCFAGRFGTVPEYKYATPGNRCEDGIVRFAMPSDSNIAVKIYGAS